MFRYPTDSIVSVMVVPTELPVMYKPSNVARPEAFVLAVVTPAAVPGDAVTVTETPDREILAEETSLI
jgi:hypothetical protein